LKQDHPLHWQALLEADQQAAPMVLRVNRRQGSREAYLTALRDLGVAAVAWGEDAIQLQEPMPVERLPGWADGAVSVQDGAAQLAAGLLMGDGVGIRRVLDACAAPGGKTAHLLEWAQTDLLALDKDARRCERIRENLDRLRLQAEVREADAGEPASWWDGHPFDAILLDAPCTASGIVRRHPDVRWLRRPSDVMQLVEQQKRLLEALWPLLRSGGRLLYCTCSVFKAEGEQQIQAFLDRHADARRLPAPGHLLTGLAGAQPAASSEDPFSDNRWRGTDGFFYALLQRQS
jgi:16S rRNA (cytosine967-C5)-methyltransferase